MKLRVAAVAVSILLLTSCSGSGSGSEPEPSAGSGAGSASLASEAASELEGAWTTTLDRDAVIAYIRGQGWSKDVEKALLAPDMAGPAQTEFRVDFVGDRFRMAQVPSDVQWQSGTYRLQDGVLYLDDEAPVGVLSFRYHLDGDVATFDHPDTQPAGPDYLPGAPDWAPGAVMWSSTPWQRIS
jgi:hypothetical protein